ncbi:G kinase-anchoring protein 1-like isoform X2 [Bacillus rossius redtenbacheri]|uniref:G kinase-anchoring protein 1-like isoform X2 n=1 Tax=Bacillus rossius redtenbacheri TaxID=93214 RepID=UPI002FDE93A5
MMATAVASRFAVLSIDDDGEGSKKNQKKAIDNIKKKGGVNQKSDTSQKKKVKKPDVSKGSQQLAKPKSKSAAGGRGDAPRKKQPASQEQWDQWKKKDSEFVDGNFEQQLEQAILLSKLDYEEKKDVYDQAKRDADEERRPGTGKKSKKPAKPQAMSLEQFNSMGAAPEANAVPLPPPEAATEHDPEFFDRIKEDAKKAIDHEHSRETRKAREVFNEEVITIAQFEETLAKKDKAIATLEEEIVKLKEELQQVKTRNKKLCNILAHGEMRDKAEVLVEVDRLQRVRDELSAEVSSLHVQLEQERSKVRALTSADTKGKAQKKRSTSETNQS